MESTASVLDYGLNTEYAVTADLFFQYGRTFRKDEIISCEGGEIFVLLVGKVLDTRRVKKGTYRVIGSFGPGEIFNGRDREKTLVSAGDTKLLLLDLGSFDTLVKKHPRWFFKLLYALGSRIGTAISALEREKHA